MTDSAHAKTTNRLVHETSPYLLQHAHNPVDWHPWGEEAIAKARAEDKPIFLSIGYSACHWCHVMERESFENEAIAEILNRHFVSLKVDREERPDLDDLYMQVVQMMTGHGGWPMSVFLTPDLKPFFAGTYFPPEDGPRGMGFGSILLRLHEAFEKERDTIVESSQKVIEAVAEQSAMLGQARDADLGITLLENATRRLEAEFDTVYGGFGQAPKFPPSMALGLLLRETERTGNLRFLEIVESTLTHMANGGIHDQLLGGFHRYSVDHQWLAPHFEKMLYDNALMAPVYFDTFLVSAKPFFLEVGRLILDYALRDMTNEAGGFYSTEDADSEGVEGKFYVWDVEEVLGVLGGDEGNLFCDYYDVTPGGNFEGRNILHVITPPREFAKRHGLDFEKWERRLEAARVKLEAVRRRRVHPGKDDKVLTAWNGMMITALARGSQTTGEERYAKAAERAAVFILENMRNEDGSLRRTWRRGESKINAFIDDYASFVTGLIDLYETTFDPRWLESAAALADLMLERFQDEAHGGFFTSDGSDPTVILRRKDFHDGATPSGNSTAALALLRLAILLDRPPYREAAMRTIMATHAYLTRLPGAVHLMLSAVAFALDRPREIAVAGDPADAETRELLRAIWTHYLPHKAVACAAPDRFAKGFNAEIALLRDQKQLNAKPTVYVCENYTCQKPVITVEEMLALLK